MKYHLRENVLYANGKEEVPAGFFGLFPCCVCTSAHHTTIMCPVLHRLCTRCYKRGHAPHECTPDGKKERFDKYAPFGLLTQTAGKRNHAPFGWDPNVPWDDQAGQSDKLAALADTYNVTDIYNMF